MLLSPRDPLLLQVAPVTPPSSAFTPIPQACYPSSSAFTPLPASHIQTDYNNYINYLIASMFVMGRRSQMGNTKIQDVYKWVSKKEVCKHNHTHTHTQILTWFYCLVFSYKVLLVSPILPLFSPSLPQLPFCKLVHFLLLSFDLFCFTFPYFFRKIFISFDCTGSLLLCSGFLQLQQVGGNSPAVVSRSLIAMASLVAEHRPQGTGFSNCGPQAYGIFLDQGSYW